MNQVEVSCEGVEPPSWRGRLQAYALAVLEERGIDGWEVSLLLCDERRMRTLNSRFRGIEASTDVLSFSQLAPPGSGFPPGAPVAAGDVVICLETAAGNARRAGVSEEEELRRVLVHGLLHLEGWEHPQESAEMDGSEMLRLQERILARLAKERLF